MAVRINELQAAVIDAKADVRSNEKSLDALLSEQTEARASVNSLLKKQAEGKLGEDGPKLTEAETRLESYEGRISAARKLVASAKDQVASAEKAVLEEQKRLDAEDKALAAAPSGRIEVKDPNFTKDPKRGFADVREFLGAVMKFGQHGRRMLDERLKPLATVRGSVVPMATQGSDEAGEYSDPAGGFLVPHGVAPGILSVEAEMDPLAGLLRDVPMTSPSVSFNARVDKNHATSVSGGFTVTRRAETVDGSATRMTFEQVVLTANEEFGLAFASERIIEDSPESFVAIIQSGFKDEYVASAMRERINGSGTGERLGFLNSGALISVAKETGQAAATLVKENIDKMEARSWKYARAVWLANHNTRPQLKSLVQVVGTGGNAVPYFGFDPNRGSETLGGRPIFFTEFCPTLGTVGDLLLIVPSEYLEGTYKSEQYAESIHVRFAAAERAFRFYRRNDGRPWWTSALQPKNGSTLSPIVALATRS